MTHADLALLLDFHYWARDRVLTAVAPLTPEQYTRDLGSSFASVPCQRWYQVHSAEYICTSV